MVRPPASLPTREEERDLHQRLVEGDPVASADLAETYLSPLIAWLKPRNRRIAEHFVEEAAGEALVCLIKNPRSFDPERSKSDKPLFAYLALSAQGDLLNLLDKEARHRARHVSLKSVELSGPDRKYGYLARNDDPSVPMELREEAARADGKVLAVVRDGLDDRERRCLEMMLEGEKKTMLFARALGIEHLPKEERKVEVKKVKDKLKKRLERKRHD